jgi:hypothetical protein
MAAVTLGRFAFGWSGGPPPRGPVDPFGFSWPLAVSLRKPPIMRVGFPWISLDSLVRIATFQLVTRLLAGKIFSSAFSVGLASLRSWHMEAQDCSRGKPNLISDFLQLIVARAVPFRPQSESSSLYARRPTALRGRRSRPMSSANVAATRIIVNAAPEKMSPRSVSPKMATGSVTQPGG